MERTVELLRIIKEVYSDDCNLIDLDRELAGKLDEYIDQQLFELDSIWKNREENWRDERKQLQQELGRAREEGM